jgi:signal transduction histidine kinase
MISVFEHRTFDNPYIKDGIYTLLFGFLSILLAEVQFQIPDVGDSNLREIPLLIGLFHIHNPVYIIVLNLFTLIGSPSVVPSWAIYMVHLLPLFIASASFKLLERQKVSNTVLGLAWMGFTVGYYLILLIPMVVGALQILTKTNEKNFLDSYLSILPSVRFEIITSSLVTGLYLMQFEIKKALEHNNKNLESIVSDRTGELTAANNELLSLNEELKTSNDIVKELNGNLENVVKERTDKINEQLNQLTKYAHMNSHELRAPLARMLGLLQLIRREESLEQMKELLGMLYDSSSELDNVIKEMNRLLEKEIVIIER